MFFIFDMQEEWTWNISNNHIIKSDVYIKLKYIRISLDIYQHLSYHEQNQKKEENNISTMKTCEMPNKWQYLTCIKVLFSNQNLQNDVDVTLGGVVTQWWCLITKGGEGGQESGKKWLHNKWMLLTM